MSLSRAVRRLSVLAAASLIGCGAKGTTLPPPVPVLDRIEVTPDSVRLDVGSTQQLASRALDTSGDPIAGLTMMWASDADSVATVSQAGFVTAVLPGTAHITASVNGKVGMSVVTVPLPAIASIELAPNSGSFEIGETVELVPTVTDVLGHSVIAPLFWLSTNPIVATVTADGKVTGLSTGPVRITARTGGIQGFADLVIIPMSVAKITVSPTTASLFIGETAPLSARLESPRGDVLTDRLVVWRSRSEFIASVSTSGEVTAISPGSVWVVAESEGNLDSALVTVSIRPPKGYDIEVVNHLLRPVELAINGQGILTLPAGATLDLFRAPEDIVRLAWALIPATSLGKTIGEAVTDTFPQAAGPDSAKLHFEIGATLTDGRRLLIPALQNHSSTTVRIGFGIMETTTPCPCILPSDEPESTNFGYWFLRAGQTLRIFGRNDAAHSGPFVAIPVPPEDVDPLTGLWHFIILAGP